MEGVEQALVLSELHIPASPKPSRTGVPQYISVTTRNAVVVRQDFCALLVNLNDLSPNALYTSVPKPAILGVAVSSCSRLVAAYSVDALYVADLDGDSQLQKVCQLSGMKAVHWCPGRAVLSVFCQQVDPFLLVLQEQQQQQSYKAAALSGLKRLTGPDGATFGARCATWLPPDRSQGAAALLAAWPADVLLYCWQSTPHGVVEWQQPQVQRLELGWPGPVRALTAAVPCGDDSGNSNGASCLVLGTVDAQLSTGAQAEGLMLQPKQQQQQGSVRTISEIAPAGGSVEVLTTNRQQADSNSLLGNLMNIHASPAAPTASSLQSSSSSLVATADSCCPVQPSSACLCMSHISLSHFINSNGTHSCNGNGQVTSSAANARGLLGTRVLPLEHLPLPNLLSVEQSVVAVASTKGPPVVNLCHITSEGGLQLLQTVSIPLPAAAGPDMNKARLEGLVLLAATGKKLENQQQQHQGRRSNSSGGGSSSSGGSSSGDSSTLFPGVDLAGGGMSSALLADPTVLCGIKQQHKPMQQQQQQQLYDVLALVTCLPAQPQPGQFISFGSSTAGATAAETFLLGCRLPQLHSAAAQQQQNTAVSCAHSTDKQQQQQQQRVSAPATKDGPPQVQQRRWPKAIVPPKLRQQTQQPPPPQQQQQQPPMSVLLPRLHAAAPPPVTSPRQLKHPIGNPQPAAAAAGTARSSSRSPRQQQQQQDRSSTDSSLSSTALSHCPWLRQVQLKEQQQQQLTALTGASSSPTGACQQQLDHLPSQHQKSRTKVFAVGADAGGEHVKAPGECIVESHSSMQEPCDEEQLSSGATAPSRMQFTLDSMNNCDKQQQHRNSTVPEAAGGLAAGAFSKVQSIMQHTPAAMSEQQQGHQPSTDPRPAAVTAAAYSTLQVAVERLTDAIEQQHTQQQAVMESTQQQPTAVLTAAAASLQVSLEKMLECVLQGQQRLLQDKTQQEQALVSAVNQMQASLEHKLDAMHETLKGLVTRVAAVEEGVEGLH